MSGMDLFIFIGLALFLVCSIVVLTIWAAGRNSNRGHWDY
jgi:hypothetical protein